MSWQVKEQFVDQELGHHVVVFHNPRSGAHHVTQIVVGATGCPLCGHVYVANVDGLDVNAIIEEELNSLNAGHQQVTEHARKHQVRTK